MKIVLFFIILISFTIEPELPKKELIWSDEFDYVGLPDPQKWSYEVGLIRNNEPQYYTKERVDNARVENGSLIITALKEEYKGSKYTSASLITLGKCEITYGRIEMRAKLPHGINVWPAFWTLGTNIASVGWPLCGEIDIMEYWGTKPDSITANIHTGDYNSRKKNYRSGKIIYKNPWEDFHIYALEWYPDRLDFFFDNTLFYSYTKKGEGIGEWPFDAPQYLLINLAIADWKKPYEKIPIDDSIFPLEYIIDYVRVYKLN